MWRDSLDNMDNVAIIGAGANVIVSFNGFVMTEEVATSGENGFGGRSPRWGNERSSRTVFSMTLKYHRYEQHVHRPDPSSNLVAETMSNYRQEIEKNPEASAKQLFEELSTKALETAQDTPNKLDIARKLPTFRKGKE